MKVRYCRYVTGDLKYLADYISLDSSRRAANLIRAIRARIKQIAKQPLLYRLRPEIGPDVGLAAVGNYVILFRISGKA